MAAPGTAGAGQIASLPFLQEVVVVESLPEDRSGSGTPASLLRLVADAVPALMAYYEVATLRCRFANQRYAQYNGWTSQDILGHTVREVIGEEAWLTIESQVQAVTSGQTVKYVREQALPTGEHRMIEVNLLPHFDDDGTQVGAFVLINDITDQWQTEQLIRESETRMRKFAQATHEGILFHHNGEITDVNEGLQRIIGYSAPELLGRQMLDFVAERWQQTVIDYVRAGREDPYEAEVLHKNGGLVPVEIVGKNMPFHGENHRLVAVRDIRARKQAQERIEYLAWHDALTELPNRLYVTEHLERTLAAARRRDKAVATLFLDLDNFKAVNDTLGHHAGDELLRTAATRLRASVRQSDLVARLAGDEFLIVLDDIEGLQDVNRVAQAVLDALRQPFALPGQTVALTPSIGISIFPDHGSSVDELILRADSAMYQAKSDGGNRYRLYLAG
jgi:diguanylate cyclase (GGDEF)-like protein/PAS domain S-box-containing protein